MYPLKNWENLSRGYNFGDNTWYGSRHRGIDIIVPEDTPIYAPFDGHLLRAFKGAQGGYTAWFKPIHDNVIIRFLHLIEMPPVTGYFDEGEIIAYSGNTGISSNPHVHIDISREKLNLYNFENFINPDVYTWSMIKIDIQLIREEDSKHEQRVSDAIEYAYDWFNQRGIAVNFDASVGHYQMNVGSDDNLYNAGNTLPDSKTINFYIGDAQAGFRTDWQVVVHEIMHAMWFEVGLGCMHNCVGEDPDVMPINFSNAGLEKVLNKFTAKYDASKHFLLLNQGPIYKDMLTKKQVRQLYVLFGLGTADSEAIDYWVGKSVQLLLDTRMSDLHDEVHNLDDNIDEE